MAGSRLEKFGTVFSRVRDLMRSGVMKASDKPVWYDVYRAFPPIRDPLHVKPHFRPRPRKQEAVPQVFYSEDAVRAKFYEQYGAGPRPLDLTRSNFVSTCQRFVDKFSELQRRGDVEESSLFEETGKVLLSEGVVLRRRGAAAAREQAAAESRDPVLELKLTDMLAEQQAAGTDAAETAEHNTHTHTHSNTHSNT